MTLEVAVAAQSDADRIADIHMAAFGTNALLRAQFPTPAIRDQLRECIAQKAADDIRDPNIAVLVVRDEGQMVSFAKWSLPVFELGTYMETPWIWPEGTNFPILSEWTEKAEAAQQKVLGELPSYRKLPCLPLHIQVLTIPVPMLVVIAQPPCLPCSDPPLHLGDVYPHQWTSLSWAWLISTQASPL